MPPAGTPRPGRPPGHGGVGRPRGDGGVGRPRGDGGWLAPLARHKWYSALGMAASLGLITGGVLALLQHGPAATAHDLAQDCGLVKCSATLPLAPATAAAAASQSRPAASPSPGHTRRRSPVSPAPATSGARPSGSPRPPSRPGGVTVTYTPASDPHGTPGQRFEGHLTIVNHGATAVRGWTLQLTFPGDSFVWVGHQGHGGQSFDTWHASGDSVILHAAASETLAPDGSQHIVIEAKGTTTTPTACSFDGAACVR